MNHSDESVESIIRQVGTIQGLELFIRETAEAVQELPISDETRRKITRDNESFFRDVRHRITVRGTDQLFA